MSHIFLNDHCFCLKSWTEEWGQTELFLPRCFGSTSRQRTQRGEWPIRKSMTWGGEWIQPCFTVSSLCPGCEKLIQTWSFAVQGNVITKQFDVHESTFATNVGRPQFHQGKQRITVFIVTGLVSLFTLEAADRDRHISVLLPSDGCRNLIYWGGRLACSLTAWYIISIAFVFCCVSHKF